MRLQLWSWNYAPEPTAAGPIATLWAEGMQARGHQVEVVAAHPHYPPRLFRQRLLPYRELRNGVWVTRLPLWIGHGTPIQRIREEATYAASAAAAMAVLPRPDAAVVVSPAFLPLAPWIARARLLRIPWVLWLQDILPDAAATTGLLREGAALRLARRLERAGYRAAERIVVISDAFAENLRSKGVPAGKIVRIYNPSTRGLAARARRPPKPPHRVLAMGNIGYSQGLPEVVRTWETSGIPAEVARLVIVGDGELADAARAEVRTDRVQFLGLVSDERLEQELERAAIGLVSQREGVAEFNLPSKLATLMARGIPILALVPRTSEVARIVEASGGGWRSDLGGLRRVLEAAARSPDDVEERGAAALRYAGEQFREEVVLGLWERVLRSPA